jgi:hypothetical protein
MRRWAWGQILWINSSDELYIMAIEANIYYAFNLCDVSGFGRIHQMQFLEHGQSVVDSPNVIHIFPPATTDRLSSSGR